MLVKAAARRWDVDWQEIDTAGGFVTYKANRLPFHALVGEIDPDDAPADPELRTNGRLAGQALLRLDVPAKVDGSARFGIDVRLPGVAYAAIDQGPIGARVASHSAPALPAGVSVVAQSGFIACVADNWFAAHKALKSLSIKWQSTESAAGPWLEAAVRGALAADGLPFRPTGTVGKAVRVATHAPTVLQPGVATRATLEREQGALRLSATPTGLWALAHGDGHDAARLLTVSHQAALERAAGTGPLRVYLGLRELVLACREDDVISVAKLEGLDAAREGILGAWRLHEGKLTPLPEWDLED
jgi:isoquinoline 1-oxidoreductase beta subunit